MDIKVSAVKQNRLFWLGRYVERTYTCVQVLMDYYDRLIDSEAPDYQDYCRRMGIPCEYEDANDFFKRYLSDKDAVCSAVRYMDCVMGNGMLLRETISSDTLAYLQLAEDALKQATVSYAPCVELQWVLDYIMAFRGSFDGSADSEDTRNITKTGGMVERISTMIRMGADEAKLKNECLKLLNRLYKTDLEHDHDSIAVISGYALEGSVSSPSELLNGVECLFKV